MKRKPWAEQTGPSDSTVRRVQVRMTFLGLSQAELAERMGITGPTVRAYMGGSRRWRRRPEDRRDGPQPVESFAVALGVPVEALEPAGPWALLVTCPPPACAP